MKLIIDMQTTMLDKLSSQKKINKKIKNKKKNKKKNKPTNRLYTQNTNTSQGII